MLIRGRTIIIDLKIIFHIQQLVRCFWCHLHKKRWNAPSFNGVCSKFASAASEPPSSGHFWHHTPGVCDATSDTTMSCPLTVLQSTSTSSTNSNDAAATADNWDLSIVEITLTISAKTKLENMTSHKPASSCKQDIIDACKTFKFSKRTRTFACLRRI